MTRHKPTGDAIEPAGTGRTAYGEPFGWWGYHWSTPAPRSLVWLIEQGALDVELAAFLSLALEARASIIVAAEPHGAGKTTLLTALLDFLPETIQPIYLRGWYEQFAFVEEVPPAAAYLLCNEISAHLPTYLWGHGVRRAFELLHEGYPLATSMHARSAGDVLQQLASYPLHVPDEHLADIDLVVTIGVGYASQRLLRRVVHVETIRPGPDGPLPETLAHREPLRADLYYQVGRLIGTCGALSGCDDDQTAASFARRVRDLRDWTANGMARVPSLRAAIAATRERSA